MFWEASQKYQKTLLEFNKLKGCESEKNLCKRKIREMNVQRAKSFSSASVDFSLSEEEKSEVEKIIKLEDIEELLGEIGKSPIFCPSFSEIKKESKNVPIFLSITNSDTQDQEGNLLKNGHDAEDVWFHQIYLFAQTPITHYCLTKIFHEIMGEKLSPQNLSDYFASKGIFPDDSLKILNVATERFFSGDFVSFLHILVPRFEKVFLDLTQKREQDPNLVSARTQKGESEKIWTQDRTLSEDFLRNEKVVNVWGKDFCEQIIFSLYSQLGLKLRHKIAHGYSKLEELNFQNSVLILYFFLVLLTKAKE